MDFLASAAAGLEMPGFLSKPFQSLWAQLLAAWPYSDQALFAAGTWAVHIGAYYGLNAILYGIWKLRLFRKYKIQGEKMPPRRLVLDTLKGNLIPHFVLQPLLFYLLVYRIFDRFGLEIQGPLPSAFTFLKHIALWFIVNDFIFYWLHRLLHHPFLYKHIHLKHHRYSTPIGISAEYAHPIEDLTANSFATIAGPMFTNTHLAVVWVYMALRIWETVEAHSGFVFPWSPWVLLTRLGIFAGPRMHDYHHSGVESTGEVGAFGMLSFWDWFCGTDRKYKAFLEREEAKAKEEEGKTEEETSQKGLQEYTAAEVGKHNTAEDCWVILDGKVYDLTEYLPEHPGGMGVILGVAGKDGTAEFQDAMHPKFAEEDKEEYLIGVLVKE